MSNVYVLLSKHQIQHGLENDEARIEAFISELEKEVEKMISPDEVFIDIPIVDNMGKVQSIIGGESYTPYMVARNHLRKKQRDTKTKFFTRGTV